MPGSEGVRGGFHENGHRGGERTDQAASRTLLEGRKGRAFARSDNLLSQRDAPAPEEIIEPRGHFAEREACLPAFFGRVHPPAGDEKDRRDAFGDRPRDLVSLSLFEIARLDEDEARDPRLACAIGSLPENFFE